MSARGEAAERRMLAMMADAGLPAPDEIEHGPSQVRFLWNDQKVAVVVDLDEEEDRDDSRAADNR